MNYTAPVDLLEADSVTTASFRPLGILIGADAPLSGLSRLTGGTGQTASGSASGSAPPTDSGASTVASATGTAGADRTSVSAATSDLAGVSQEASSGASLGASATSDSAMIVQRQPSLSQLERACVTTRSNLRAGPGTDYGVRAVLEQGEVLYIRRRTADGRWNQIVTDRQAEGWIYFSLIRGC